MNLGNEIYDDELNYDIPLSVVQEVNFTKYRNKRCIFRFGNIKYLTVTNLENQKIMEEATE